MHRILVVPGELEALLSAKCLAPAEGDAGDQTISTLAAADYLNTKEVTVIHLMQLKEGLKSRSRGKNRRPPLRVSVEDFSSKYMLGGEVCAALCLAPRQLIGKLAEHRIIPAFRIEDATTVWRRKEIDRVRKRTER
jgi:hypothetical protein